MTHHLKEKPFSLPVFTDSGSFVHSYIYQITKVYLSNIQYQSMVWFRRTRNLKRRIFSKDIGYVHVTLVGDIPLYNPQKPFIQRKVMPQPELTLLDFYRDTLYFLDQRKVKGLIVHLSDFSLSGTADYEFLRDILSLWMAKGREVIVYTHQLSTLNYFLASVADKVYLIQGGIFGVIGLQSSVQFYKQFLENYGLQFQVVQISPYKSAGNFLSYDEMPPEQEEMINWLLDSLYGTITSAIAEGREKSIEEVQALVDSCPMSAKKALENGWIDGIISPAELPQIVGDKITSYAQVKGILPIPKRKRGRIALLPALGGISDGKGGSPIPIPQPNRKEIADVPFVQAIRRIRKHRKKYDACLMFVDSPGGSATASEAILNELKELSKELPLYAFFHNVAGSGGYYISMASKEIYAHHTTITASIGVLNGKFVRKEFLEKQKIKPYSFKRGKHADIASPNRPWTEEEYNIVFEQISTIYEIFLNHVHTNRNLPVEEIDKVAKGKVWTAPQAKEHQLLNEAMPFHDVLEKIADNVGTSPTFEIIEAKGTEIAPFNDAIALLENFESYVYGVNGKPMMLMFPQIKISG